MAGTAQYLDGYWWSDDGLRLHYRDYAGPEDRLPIICIPGLTRNARDFEPIVRALAGERRMLCAELRGRGESAPAKDPMSYVPLTYAQDIMALIKELGLRRFILMGTSLGGLVSMLLAALGTGGIAGVILNDIGPKIEEAGLVRIRGYVGKPGSWPTWMHAARSLSESQGSIYPDFKTADWLAMAKRLYRLTSAGRIVQDYDARIAEPMRQQQNETMDLWPVFKALADIPTLIIRGESSDILSAATAKEMKAGLKKGKLVTIPQTGHAPILDEKESVAAIRAFLKPLAV